MKTHQTTWGKVITAFCFCTFAIGTSYSQQDHQRITGSYSNPNNMANTYKVNCGCNSPGILHYEDAEGDPHTLLLCFDTEPGSFYEIFEGEGITVEGNLRLVTCDDSETHEVLFVVKSEMEIQNRRELVPEFIKKQPGQGSKER
ncbi:hypothetical protein [Fluviicola sp.]|uniref:hypothetical protein n=1 Tax=Fluviicola sp. TaxID=1917219 RepID=UPI0031E383E5